MSAGAPLLSLVIPMRNNEEGVVPTLALLRSILEPCEPSYEILAVVNDPTDRTFERAEWYASTMDHRVRCVRVDVESKAQTVARGLRECRGEVWGFVDGDLGTVERRDEVAEQIEGIIEILRTKESDCVIGDRSEIQRLRGHRRGVSRIFNAWARLLFGLPFADTQCGLKLFTAAAGRDVLRVCQLRGWEFDVEMLAWMRWLGYRIQAHPVSLHNPSDGQRGLVAALLMGLTMGVPMAWNLLLLRVRAALVRSRTVKQLRAGGQGRR